MALILAGCTTSKESTSVTEVKLTESGSFPVSSGPVDTSSPQRSAPALPGRAVPATNAITRARVIPQTNGWVLLTDWAAAYRLSRPRELSGERYLVETPRGSAILQPGSQILRWNGTTVWLGYAPRYLRGQPCLHWLDVDKTLDPLLRPVPPIAKPGRIVVIDPGHGGSDGGTQGTPQQLEKNFTLDWALRLERLLTANGWRVFLTRTNDADVSLPARAEVADRVGADLFLSLHFNGLAGGSDHGGIEAFQITPAGMPSTIRRSSEESLSPEYPANVFDAESLGYAYQIQQQLLASTKANDGGVRRARFLSVLRGQRRTAVLVEGGFLTNPAEARRIASAEYRQKLAEAVDRALNPLLPTSVASQR
jgi:N-acetylmuramoyl-L-alanine amidase